MSKMIKTLSLFSGAGGLDIGFHQAGFDIIACVELESKYCATLKKNAETLFNKQTDIHCQDIREFDYTQYADAGIECIIGGPPCQTFSAAGRRSGGVLGTNDERGLLYSTYCEILKSLKPKVFVFENVYGLPGANGGKPWQEILSAFKRVGYHLHAEVLDAADYGTPQHRERLFMVGLRDNESFTFPLPTHGPDSGTKTKLVTVGEAISDLQSENEPYHDNLGGLYGHLLPSIPEGLNYSFFTAEMGHPEPVFAWRSKFHDLLYKVRRDTPCRTIKSHPGKFTGPFHWKNRHFTPEELKRLQTFPDEYEIVGSYQTIVEQIGNSVPPRLAFVIAASVKEQIFNTGEKLKYHLRPPAFKSTFRQRQRERSKKYKEIALAAIKQQYKDQKSNHQQDSSGEYIVGYDGLFTRAKLTDTYEDTTCYAVKFSDTPPNAIVNISNQTNDPKYKICIQIEGLKKYLPSYTDIQFQAVISNAQGIFHTWKEVETFLVERSNFFTLIDIYGHYANRGDVVNIVTKIEAKQTLEKSPTITLIEFFSQTNNCGSFLNIQHLADKFSLSDEALNKIIKEMRKLRFDIRTSKTHPIIKPTDLICTYPFPLLSRKALVESKANYVATTKDSEQIQKSLLLIE
jgi:DNA (cytosine-5)-methyltransferase 1